MNDTAGTDIRSRRDVEVLDHKFLEEP